jgi:excisionase family DNA binding protein
MDTGLARSCDDFIRHSHLKQPKHLRFFRIRPYLVSDNRKDIMARETTVLPGQDSALLDALGAVLQAQAPASLTVGDRSVQLPPELRKVLAEVVRAMRRGQAVTFAPMSQQLTTQQAADLIGVSRPTLIKLLETGRIPYETPGRHRRLRLSDVLAFQELRRTEQREALRELAQDAQDLGLYNAPPETFSSALAEARRKHA